MVILQGYWLSPTTSRNWLFLWSSQSAPAWAIVLLILLFFVGVWAGLLAVLGHLTKQHSWFIPIFAIGLGAPGWCQMLWGISGIGNHIPWLGVVGGALFSRSVWLWLGVLHAIQDVGFGMILLQTLTRVHITFVFTVAQIVGAFITIIARATAPNKIGPGTVFHNFGDTFIPGVYFWICLLCQLVICVGYFKVCTYSTYLNVSEITTNILSSFSARPNLTSHKRRFLISVPRSKGGPTMIHG